MTQTKTDAPTKSNAPTKPKDPRKPRPINFVKGGLEPGVHENVPDETYFALPYLSQSQISASFDDYGRFLSLAHGKAEQESFDAEGRNISAMRFGTALHQAVLDPKVFDDRAVLVEKSFAASTRGRVPKTVEDFAWADEQFGRRTILLPGWKEQITAMRSAIMAHDHASKIVASMRESARPELVLVWDEHVGEKIVRCKAKLDRHLPEIGLVDIKTTRDRVSPEALRRTVLKLGYHRQAAWYTRGAIACGLITEDQEFFIVAVEKSEPHGVAVITIDAERDAESHAGVSSFDLGWGDCIDFLGRYAAAYGTGEWTGYDQTITTLDLPNHAFIGRERPPFEVGEFIKS